jgi:hypothetical protein
MKKVVVILVVFSILGCSGKKQAGINLNDIVVDAPQETIKKTENQKTTNNNASNTIVAQNIFDTDIFAGLPKTPDYFTNNSDYEVITQESPFSDSQTLINSKDGMFHVTYFTIGTKIKPLVVAIKSSTDLSIFGEYINSDRRTVLDSFTSPDLMDIENVLEFSKEIIDDYLNPGIFVRFQFENDKVSEIIYGYLVRIQGI